jgi:DNA-binding CsgD family transcriptional regulator
MTEAGSEHGCPLTRRQLQIVELLAEGLTYKQIALRVGLGQSTVRSHLHQVYGKLGVHDRAQAVLACEREGWIDSPGLDASERILVRLERVMRDLCRLVRERSQLTDPQRAFISAFDQLLYAQGDEDKLAAQKALESTIGLMLPPGVGLGARQRRDLVELLVDYIARA